MPGDTRLFRITYDSGTVKYGNRRVAGPAAAYFNAGNAAYRLGYVTKIEATNAEATEGWTDVTTEFLKEDA